jgi:sulfopyruvate decarboxylase subunit beta
MERLECLKQLVPLVEDCLAVVALGGTTDEWDRVRPSDANFFNVAMGSNMPLAMGLAFALPHRRIVLLDTDGCQLMTLGALCTLANYPPPNLRIFVLDNECYAGTGGQPSATAGAADLAAIARGAGVETVLTAGTIEEFRRVAMQTMHDEGLAYVVAKVESEVKGPRTRRFDHVEAKYRFVRYVEELEGRPIMTRY